MQLVVINSIRAAKRYFDMLVPEHSFQSYTVQCAMEKSVTRGWYYSAVKRPWRFFWHVPKCKTLVVLSENGCPILLAPVRLAPAMRRCWCMGETQGSTADYVDFLYGDAPDADRLAGLKLVFAWLAEHGCPDVQFTQILSTSPTLEYVAKLGLSSRVIQESKSVFINIRPADELVENPADSESSSLHERYFASLGKHAKQNVRTAYNRLKRDGHVYRLGFFSRAGIGLDIDSEEGRIALRDCERVYCDRQNERYNRTPSRFAALKHWYAQQFWNYTTLAKDSPDLMLAVLYVDGEIAALMRGYFKYDRSSIELPRLAINEKFGWYSPGLVMLNETAKFFLASTSVRGIDLCRGTEKYKLDMGGGYVYDEDGRHIARKGPLMRVA